MLLLDVLEEPLVVVARSIHHIPLAVADEALFLDPELPLTHLHVFGLLFVEQHADDETVVDHGGHEDGQKFGYVPELKMVEVVLINLVLVHAQVLEVSVLHAAGDVDAAEVGMDEELVVGEDESHLYANQDDQHQLQHGPGYDLRHLL